MVHVTAISRTGPWIRQVGVRGETVGEEIHVTVGFMRRYESCFSWCSLTGRARCSRETLLYYGQWLGRAYPGPEAFDVKAIQPY